MAGVAPKNAKGGPISTFVGRLGTRPVHGKPRDPGRYECNAGGKDHHGDNPRNNAKGGTHVTLRFGGPSPLRGSVR